ncbi:hypothetical protein ASPTUDRAFT_56938 [Aspergillus tubingensis CBS 134.48]|uniref:Metacaspase n=1 Tax=Aspergillus tubingensis (strain CBS 134.48) TaxID=767770 RepID=A0A1L9N0Y6_ASPTC|nr:hypothetical protein ASPTUDRAFT_56938 [Aspergillus tubingensis CBS 134.48]
MGWELDDTNADLDTAHFQSMLRNFDTNPPEVLVLGSDDRYPMNTLQRTWLSIKEKVILKNERSLIIFHYAGHGTTVNGSFSIAENTSEESKTANFERAILADVKDPNAFPDHTDALFILDCCYAHYTTRAPKTSPNVIEILAATSSQTVTARSAPDNTFTAKLASEIARRKRAHHEGVDFASVFQSLLSRSATMVRLTHALLVGAASVNIPLNGHRTVDPRTFPADYHALFAVHVSRDVTKEELIALSTWMRKLPSFAGLKIEQNPGPDLTHLLQPELSEDPASPPSSPKKENLPFRSSKNI